MAEVKSYAHDLLRLTRVYFVTRQVKYHPTTFNQVVMKKVLGAMQTLPAVCSKAEPKKIALPQTPFPGVQDGQNLISWRRSLPSLTDPVW